MDAPENLERQLFGHLVRLIHRISQAGAEELAEFGISPAQYQLLMLINREPGITQVALTERLGVTKGNVSQLVKKLEQSKWIVRSRATGRASLSLSNSGTALLARIEPAHENFMQRAFANLSQAEISRLLSIVKKL